MKFNINANTYEKSKRQSPNCVRSNQESLGVNSLVININDATKGKNDESSKIEQIWTDKISNDEDGETDNDNKRHHTAITKH